MSTETREKITMTGKYVDREGKHVRVLCVDHGTGPLRVIADDQSCLYYLDEYGCSASGEQVLFPAPQQIEFWGNVFHDIDGTYSVSEENYESEKEAKEIGENLTGYRKTVRVVLDV